MIKREGYSERTKDALDAAEIIGITRVLEACESIFLLDDGGLVSDPYELSLWGILSALRAEQYGIARREGDFETALEHLSIALGVAVQATLSTAYRAYKAGGSLMLQFPFELEDLAEFQVTEYIRDAWRDCEDGLGTVLVIDDVGNARVVRVGDLEFVPILRSPMEEIAETFLELKKSNKVRDPRGLIGSCEVIYKNIARSKENVTFAGVRSAELHMELEAPDKDEDCEYVSWSFFWGKATGWLKHLTSSSEPHEENVINEGPGRLTTDELIRLLSAKLGRELHEIKDLVNRLVNRKEYSFSGDTPFTNLMQLREILRSCEQYIWWADPHFKSYALDEIIKVVNPRKVKIIRILSQLRELDRGAKEDFNKFRKEMQMKGITAEWRVNDRLETHDRFIVGANTAFNIPAVGTMYGEQYSEGIEKKDPQVAQSNFIRWWDKARSVDSLRI